MTPKEHIKKLMKATDPAQEIDYYGQTAYIHGYSITREIVGWTYTFEISVYSKYGRVGNFSNTIEIFSESFVDNRSE